MSPRKAIPLEDLSPQVQDLCNVLNDADDLACVLISVSFLDECLASMLAQHLVASKKLKAVLSPSRWLGTYGARVDLAYLVGLIPKGLFKNLVAVGEVRNRFAHSHLSMSFSDGEVGQLCRGLSYPRVRLKFSVGFDPGAKPDPWLASDDPRQAFTVIVLLMAQRLILTGLSVQRLEGPTRGWE